MANLKIAPLAPLDVRKLWNNVNGVLEEKNI